MFRCKQNPIYRRLFLFLLTLGLFVRPLSAQEEETVFHPYFFINGNLQAGIPLQLFSQKGQVNGYGGGGLFLAQLGRRPFFAGLEVSMMRFDSERVNFEEVINGFVEEFEQTTKNNAFLAHLVVRAQPWDNGLFRPYLDGLFGVKDLYTRTTLENLATEDSESNTDTQDWSLSYGLALGLQLGVFRNEAISIDIRCVFLTGNNATFLVRRPGATGPFFAPIEAFEEQNAPPTVLLPQIGVTIDISTMDYY